jgi:hypothetical protein
LRNSRGSVTVVLAPYYGPQPASVRVLFEGIYSTNNPKIPKFTI